MEETLKQRKKDEARENLARELKENEALAEYERRRDAIQERGKLNDFKRNLHTKRREACREEKLRRDQRTADLTRQKTLRAEKLAHELSQLKNAELVKEKRRQLLRESSEELRQLEVQLRSAYAAKEVHLQILEKEAKRKEERRREREAFFVDNWSLEDARQLQLQDREKKHKYRREIQDQLIGNYRRRQEDSEEKQREGKLAEELSQVLREEGEALKNRKLRKAAQLRAEEEAFFRARGIWKEKEKEALEDEHYRLQEIIGKKETEEKERLEKAKAEWRERMTEAMARKMVQEEDGRREREDTVKELCEQKMKSELEGRIKSEQSKKRLLRTELLEEMASQKRVVAEFRKKEAEMDAAFARNNDEQTRIDREKDRREAEARRERGIQYGQELRAAITRARAKLAEEARRERSLKSLQDERETLRRREIAEERARILSKHAPRLRGFLKPGIVKPEN